MFLVGLSRIRMIVLTDPDPGNLYVLAKYFLKNSKIFISEFLLLSSVACRSMTIVDNGFLKIHKLISGTEPQIMEKQAMSTPTQNQMWSH